METADMIKTGDNVRLKERLKENPDLVKNQTEQGISLLQYAAYCRNVEAVEMIRGLLDGIDIFEAASIGEKETLLDRLDKRPDQIDATSVDGFTPLGLASFFGHTELVTALLDRGANPNTASNNAFHVTPLHSACAISHYDIAAMLIKKGADVNAKQMQGVTPLHSAAHNGKATLAKLLIENGADIHAKTENGQTPLSMAEDTTDKETIELLKKYGRS